MDSATTVNCGGQWLAEEEPHTRGRAQKEGTTDDRPFQPCRLAGAPDWPPKVFTSLPPASVGDGPSCIGASFGIAKR